MDLLQAITPIPVTSPAGAAVFQEVLLHGPVPRVAVARATGLSPAAVTKAAAPLVESGYLVELDAAPSKPGRPSRPMAVNAGARHAIGIKIRPDRVHAVAADLTAEVLAMASARPDSADPADIERTIRGLVSRLRARLPDEPAGIGIGVSGEVDQTTGVVRNSPHMGWRQVPLAQRLGDLGPVLVDNDVHALTRSEWMFGSGRGTSSFALVTLGSGIGCGIVSASRVVHGAFGVAGELGHLPLAPGDRLCVCGRRGCVETAASSGSIAALVGEACEIPGLSFDDAITLARGGDDRAATVLTAAGETVGRALACLANLVGPAAIVVSGEGVDAFDIYRRATEDAYQAHAFADAGRAPIRSIAHNWSDWARGAAVNVIWAVARGT